RRDRRRQRVDDRRRRDQRAVVPRPGLCRARTLARRGRRLRPGRDGRGADERRPRPAPPRPGGQCVAPRRRRAPRDRRVRRRAGARQHVGALTRRDADRPRPRACRRERSRSRPPRPRRGDRARPRRPVRLVRVGQPRGAHQRSRPRPRRHRQGGRPRARRRGDQDAAGFVGQAM
ncbi:MAG: hypothetical protein AVDCRST_MAG91-588, partial [uncultured Sphingomonadaceae bacterium]